MATPGAHAVRPLLGRAAQLDLIGSHVAGLDQSRGALLLLTGEPGIGKTRLADEVVALARAHGARTAWTISWQGAGAPPLWPWIQVLRQLEGSERALGRVAPESPAASVAAQFAQFERVGEIIRRVASEESLVVVLEDLQWAEASSIRLLAYVASATRDVGCLLVGTYRTGELDSEHVAELAHAGTTLAVPPLSPADACELLRAAAGQEVSASAIDAVVERSAGNPLFIWEFGQLMAQSGRLEVAPAAVPEAVAAVIERRLARLPEVVVAILRTAAVAGKSFTVELVATVGDGTVEDVADALEVAVGAGIVVRSDLRTYSFTHDLVHEVVLRGAEHGRRVEMHRRAAAAFRERLQTDPSLHAVVAGHLEQAGPEHADEASLHWENAARSAQTVLAYEQAAVLFARAALAASTNPHRRVTLTLEEGESLLLSGDLDAARARFMACVGLARAISAPDLVAFAVLGMGAGPVAWEVPIASSEHAALVADALDALPSDAIRLRSRLLARLSVTAATPEAMGTARDRAAGALALAQELQDGRLIAEALAAVNDAHGGPAYTMLRRENADAIVELGAATGDRMLQLVGYRFRIVADLEVGDLAAVDRTILEFSELAEQLRQPLVSWYVPLFRGMRALLSGDLGAAARGQREVAAAASATGSSNARMLAATLLLGIEVASGTRSDPNALDTLFDIDPADWASYASGLAMVSWHAGDHDRARTLLKLHADNGFARLGDDGEHLTTLLLFGRVAVGLGERSAAHDLYELLLPHSDLWAVDGIAGCCWGPVELELGRLALALDNAPLARRHLAAARVSAERAKAPLLLRDVEALAQRCEHVDAAETEVGGVEPNASQNVFGREGQFWTLSYRGRTIRMKDAKGLQDLARLIAEPGTEVHVLDLIGTRSDGAGDAVGRAGDLGELLDARARAEYRRRVAELEDELADAERCADLARAERARVEREFIASELAAALGLGGRPRRAGDPAERARKAVTARIRLTIGRIDSEHPDLGKHLTNSVRTGTFCVYQPERPLAWLV